MVAVVALVYLGDLLSFRLQLPNHRAQFGTVHVQPLLAVPQKNGRTEFILDDARDEPCANALFPQGGTTPCWYLQRHSRRRVNL